MLDPGTIRHLEALGVGQGWSCLEVGGGGGSIAAWLCERVGSSGHVLATDVETQPLAALEYSNLEVRRHDIVSDELPAGQFDLVHARWVLNWLPAREQALTRMVSALRPGGWLLAEEADVVTLHHGSTSEAFLKVARAFTRQMEALSGADLLYGRRLFGDLCAQGLVNEGAEGQVCIIRGGAPSSVWLRLSIERVRTPLVGSGVVTNEEMQEALALLDNPAFTTMAPLTIAAWGRRPGR
jgi:SAM-dependent methyltransferase